MANARDVTVDIVGRDKTSAATKSAAKNFDALDKKVKDSAKGHDRLGDAVKRMQGRLQVASRTMAVATSMTAGFTSVLAPLTVVTAKAVLYTGRLVVAMAPLLATLPAVAGAVGLVTAAVTGMGRGIVRGLAPVTAEFTGLIDRMASLTAKEMPALSRAFLRVNFPVIAAGVEQITKHLNSAVVSVGEWVNSLSGQKAISAIVKATAASTERLAPKMASLAISFGNLVARAGDPAIKALGGLLGTIADRTRQWVESITRKDITDAIQKAKDAAHALGGKLSAVKEIVTWIGDNAGKIKVLSDALAGVGIVLGLATGAWPAAVAGAATLALNHLEPLKAGFNRVKDVVSRVWSWMANDPSMQRIGQSIKEVAGLIRGDFAAAWKYLKAQFDALKPSLESAWAAVGPFIVGFLKNSDVRAGLRAIALGIAALTVGFAAFGAAVAATTVVIVGALAGITAWLTGKLLPIVRSVVSVVLGAFAGMARGIAAAIRPFNKSLADSLEAAARKADSVADDITRALNRIQGKSIPVNVITQVNGRQVSVSDMGRVISGSAGGARIAFSSFRGFTAAASPGGGRTQAPTPVNVTSTVMLDGSPFWAYTHTAVAGAGGALAHRARVGRRY